MNVFGTFRKVMV